MTKILLYLIFFLHLNLVSQHMNKQKRYFKGSKTLNLGNIVSRFKIKYIKGQNVKNKKLCKHEKSCPFLLFFLRKHLFQLSYDFLFVFAFGPFLEL